MEKEFIPYKQSLALKGLGFDEYCIATIDQTEYVHVKKTKSLPRGSMMYDTIDCPLYQQAFRWFNKKRGLYSSVFKNAGKFEVYIENLGTGSNEITVIEEGALYEEAELECLKKLIEIVKGK
jgi:hypothetical protein